MNPTLRTTLRTVTVLSCLPYLALKVAWVAGSRVGIPDGSSLLDHRTTMAVANGVTVLLDAAVVLLAFLLTEPWGRRVPAWALTVPMWVATGLLTPIMTGYPVQMVVKLFDGSGATAGASEPFLDDWVFSVVYPGFVVQGLCLGALFAGYARRRWGHVWQGRMRDLPARPQDAAQRLVAVAAVLCALLPAVTHLLWACGADTGLNPLRAAERDSTFTVMEVMNALYLAAAVTGAVLLAFRRGRGLSLKVPLALLWVGSGASACWGGWLSLASLSGVDDIARQPTPLMNLTYAGQMIVGLLVVTIGAHHAAVSRAATPSAAPARTPVAA
ncbi:hypothetical protein GTW43_27625 [Streptomyces sp. SID5785]|uniref:hypothetical protein n=1 Tax=Streptomyces sp. SID5785 TaxID=2690309 RepID=UPI001361C89C|nr:hypothetical protein [Streptomyces sp. SID5785]MZD08818.1 hypothetical protein [Streptomyces sp. SID5785]